MSVILREQPLEVTPDILTDFWNFQSAKLNSHEKQDFIHPQN